MRPSVRFDVFKRDAFTCQYCGRRIPDVTLEVDHILPRARGGGDELENLITACLDCNRGKGATPLDTVPATEDLRQRTELIKERERQIVAYNQAKAQARERQDDEFNQVWTAWFDAWNADSLYPWHLPWEGVLRRYIELLGPDECIDAIGITLAKFNYLTTDTVRYFVGVLKHKAGER